MNTTDFDGYYWSIFGSRWERLRAILTETNQAVAYSEGLQEPYILSPPVKTILKKK